MSILHNLVNRMLKGILRLTCRIDFPNIESIPKQGPLLIVTNHVSALEGPLLYLFMRPRNTIALAKKELWDHAVTRRLMQWWECIPVNRDNLDRQALSSCFEVLDRADILCIAAEGTRSKDGTLQQGKPGSGFIAWKKQVSILPISHSGLENFGRNIKRLRRTPVTVRIGRPFKVCIDSGRLSPDQRQRIADEMMMRIAENMPQRLRGFYASKEPYSYEITCDVRL